MSKANLIDWFVEAAAGEPIIGVVIGSVHRHWDDEYNEGVPTDKVLSWTEAALYLNKQFHSGFGGAGCPPVYVWTENYVIHITEYGGATGWHKIPRNPIDCQPTYN